MQCKDVSQTEACYTLADGSQISITKNTVFNSAGGIHATYYTDAAGIVLDTATGVVVAGACQLPNPDVEWEQLCDVDAEGVATKFLRRSITRFASDSSVIDPVEVKDFETDKVTDYTVAGVVGDCRSCETETPLGLITDLSALS